MLTSLIEIINTGEFEDNGSLSIEAASAHQDGLLVRLRLVLPDGGSDVRSVYCHRPRSHELLAAEFADDLSVCEDHVLLWPHVQEKNALYFNGRADDGRSLLGALLQTHHQAVGEWFEFTRFMNDALFSPAVELLASQSGLLAEGPEPLIASYRSVLTDFGIRHSSPPSRDPSWWDGTQWQPETERLYALVIGRSYVIAPNFTEEVAKGCSRAVKCVFECKSIDGRLNPVVFSHSARCCASGGGYGTLSANSIV